MNHRRRMHHAGPPTPGNELISLSALRPGEQGIITDLAGGRGMRCRMASLGFTPGTKVSILRNSGRGPIITRVRDARIALGRGEARHVFVRREEK